MKKWGEKPYYSLDYYFKQTYGRKIYKVSLDGGMTCPNRDGTLGDRGCIFCSKGGSGDFASSSLLSITDQIEAGKHLILSKLPTKTKQTDGETLVTESAASIESTRQYIAYFQAYTNTYGKIGTLRKIFFEAINHSEVVGLSIATRPDCLGSDILALLAELNTIKPVWIELGLQTCHEETARFIRRGYSLPIFEEAVKNLQALSIQVIVHLILGLPGETKKDILETVTYVSHLKVNGIKLQLLHVLEDTDLAHYSFCTLTKEEYIDQVISCLEIIPENIVIHRVTGDGPKNLLIAPKWSQNKKSVLNELHKTLKERNTWQGRYSNHYLM